MQPGQGGLFLAFGSNHPGVVQFCFADGSVRGLRYGLTAGYPNDPPNACDDTTTVHADNYALNPPDWLLFQRLAGIREGSVVSPGALTLE
jgi:prepilin-type processing-associated H-X9-DG protein